MWDQLGDVGRDRSTGGYHRFAWTREDAVLREWFCGQAEFRRLDVTTDRCGNLWAWWGDPDGDGPGVVTGSHLDSVPDGGAYDGPLGVVSALAAVDLLRTRGTEPVVPIGIVVFADEEGARFGVACAGSGLLTGGLDPDRARALTDARGTTMAQAMSGQGHNPHHVGRDDDALRRVETFVELHIEQGRQLIHDGVPVGVASGIWPHGRWRLDLIGAADHAGTTRLEDRDDPMLFLASVIRAARAAAEDNDALATVGKVAVHPGAVNAIASRVSAWLDARGRREDDVRRVVEQVAAAGATGAVLESWTPDTVFDERLRARLVAVVGRGAVASPTTENAPVLATGAGHDAGVLSAAGVPTGMLFVRNPTGVSHSPAEHADEADCLAGVAALADVLEDLATRPPSETDAT